MFLALGQYLKHLNTQACHVIDSLPVAVCDNVPINRCRLPEGEAYRGYPASRRRYSFGFKAQLFMTHDGPPVELYLHASSKADITGLKALDPQQSEGSVLYADAAHTDYTLEDEWREAGQVELAVDL